MAYKQTVTTTQLWVYKGHTYIYLKQWFILYPLRESFKSSTSPILQESLKHFAILSHDITCIALLHTYYHGNTSTLASNHVILIPHLIYINILPHGALNTEIMLAMHTFAIVYIVSYIAVDHVTFSNNRFVKSIRR